MPSTNALAVALALLLSSSAANAFFILTHAPLVMTRLDPIISPGQVSQHEHNILGGSKFASTYNYDDLITSQCTTAVVSIDKSNYWAPQLYYYEPVKQTFQAIPSYSKTYYLQRPGDKNERIMAFPKGLKMVAGNPYRRSFNPNSYEDQAVSFVCLDYYNDHSGDPEWEQRNDFFKHNCPDGLRAQVYFPSCWDGVNLDSSDHKSHVAYPVDNFQGGNCPASHPVHLVSLFYEFVFSVGDFPFNDPQYPTWVFANGDTSGFSFHGDFQTGWPAGENSVLQQALDQCGLETGGVVEACAPFQPYLDQASANACKPENDVVNELNGWGYPIPKLPGDNPMWSGPSAVKPSSDGYVENSGYVSGQSTLPSGWSRKGCIAEANNGRALNAASWTSPTMTNAACASHCDGLKLPLAGVEYGGECYCDSELRNGATDTLLSSGRCATTCLGLKSENCGGASTLTLMENPQYAVAPALPDGWSAGDCMTEGSGSRALDKASMSSDSMTVETCVAFCSAKGLPIAGLEYSSQCYCGDSFGPGSVVATDGKCNMPCSGKMSQTCGGPDRLSTYKTSNATISSRSSVPPASSSFISSFSHFFIAKKD